MLPDLTIALDHEDHDFLPEIFIFWNIILSSLSTSLAAPSQSSLLFPTCISAIQVYIGPGLTLQASSPSISTPLAISSSLIDLNTTSMLMIPWSILKLNLFSKHQPHKYNFQVIFPWIFNKYCTFIMSQN